jgi:hypothetical protein
MRSTLTSRPVDKTALASSFPATRARSALASTSADGHVRAPGEEDPRAQLRDISSRFFAALGVPIIAAGFQCTTAKAKPVVIVATLAKRMFPNAGRRQSPRLLTDPVMKFVGVNMESTASSRRRRYR